jgi:hypothetical protein
LQKLCLRHEAAWPTSFINSHRSALLDVDPGLAGERMELYERADAYAARFCRRLADTLRRATSAAHTAALAELRRFYRLPLSAKLAHISTAA